MSTLWIMSSALGNSMLHKVSHYTKEKQQKSFGSFFLLMMWLGLLIFVNFLVFAKPVIHFIAGSRRGTDSFLTQVDGSIYEIIGHVISHFSSFDQSLL